MAIIFFHSFSQFLKLFKRLTKALSQTFKSLDKEVNTDVKITYYRLHEFCKLFEFNHLSMKLLEKSLSPILNTEQVFQTGEGAGKSGSFFFLSHDERFMIKTMKKSEITTMLKILPAYIKHHQRNPQSLLAKIFGIFTVKKKGFDAQHVMLMEFTRRLQNKEKEKFVYDLKGSTYDRFSKGKLTNKTMRKDLDWVRDKNQNQKMLGMSPINQRLVGQLRRDVAFLKMRGLLDYSLLVSVESTEKAFDVKSIIKDRRASQALMRNQQERMARRQTQDKNFFSPSMLLQKGGLSSVSPKKLTLEHENPFKVSLKSSSFVTHSQKPLLLYNNLLISVERHQQEDELDAGLQQVGNATSVNSDLKPKEELKETDEVIVEDMVSDDDQSYDLSAISRQIREIPEEQYLEILASKHDFEDDGKVFHLSIIDYLQSYNRKKKLERAILPYVNRCDGDTISAQPPRFYGDRFLNFMTDKVFQS